MSKESVPLQILGLCRFSYRTAEGGGFRRKESLADCAEAPPALYQRERLEHRLHLFKRLCLPGILGQTDPDFRLIILTGKGLPGFARRRLKALVRGQKQLILHQEPDLQPHVETCQTVLLTYRDPDIPFVAEFNMDDDDSLATDFVAELRRHFAMLRPMVETMGHLELDFCRGFAARVEGRQMRVKHVLAPHWGVAQAFLLRTEPPLTFSNFHHFRYWRRNPAVSISRKPMFLRSFHAGNDSGRNWSQIPAEKFRPKEDGVLPALTRRFNLPLEKWRIRVEGEEWMR